MPEYEVSVTCDFFDHESPEEAVESMKAWLADDLQNATYWVAWWDDGVRHKKKVGPEA